MYSVILLSVVLVLLSPGAQALAAHHQHHHKRGPPPRHHHHCPPDHDIGRFAKHLADDIKDVDEKVEHFCKDQKSVEVKEYYGRDAYKLIVRVQNLTEVNLEIKTRYRVVSLEHEETVVMKVLPDVVTPVNASYIVEEDQVYVIFQYRIEFDTEMKIDCEDDNYDFSSKTITVKKSQVDGKVNNEPQIDNVSKS